MKRTTIRGARIVREPYEPPGELRHSLDHVDATDNLIATTLSIRG